MVDLGSLGSFGCALGVVGCIRGSSFDDSGAPSGALGTFGVVGFIRLLSGGCWVDSGSLG